MSSGMWEVANDNQGTAVIIRAKGEVGAVACEGVHAAGGNESEDAQNGWEVGPDCLDNPK